MTLVSAIAEPFDPFAGAEQTVVGAVRDPYPALAEKRRTTPVEVVDALGDDADELLALLEPWAKAVVDSGGYPSDPSKLTRR